MKTTLKFAGFDTLKRAVSMIQLLDRYGVLNQLHRRQDTLSGTCPIHAGHNRSQFRVSISRNCWICFGDCHAGGSIIDFVSRKEQVGVREAGLLIQDWFGVEPSDSKSSNGHHSGQLGAKPNGHAVESGSNLDRINRPLPFVVRDLDASHTYLVDRGLSRVTIETFGVGYCSKGSLGGWIAIPIHNPDGQLVAYAKRWPGDPPENQPKYLLPRGFRKSLELFNLHRAAGEDSMNPLVIVEGFFGAMWVWQAGFRRVVAAMGSTLSPAQAELVAQAVAPGGRVVVLFDEDEAGRKGRAEALKRLDSVVQVTTPGLDRPGIQPENLSPEQLCILIGS